MCPFLEGFRFPYNQACTKWDQHVTSARMRLQNVIYNTVYDALSPETHTKRHATQHVACPACWAMGTNCVWLWWGKKYFALGRLEQPRQNKNLLHRHDKPNELTKVGHLSFVLFESPFTSVSTVSRGQPSLVSLFIIKETDSLSIPCLLKIILLFPFFFYFGCSGNSHFFFLCRNGCITSTTVVDASAVAAIATIIAVAAVVVAAVDGAPEARQCTLTYRCTTYPLQKFYVTFIAYDKQ